MLAITVKSRTGPSFQNEQNLLRQAHVKLLDQDKFFVILSPPLVQVDKRCGCIVTGGQKMQ